MSLKGKTMDDTDFSVRRLGIIGAGMMGQGIAFSAANAGIKVVLKDVTLAAAEKGKAYSALVMEKRIARGQAGEDQKQPLIDCIYPTADIQHLEGCDLIIEAVFEDMALKHSITHEFENCLNAGGIWATNTSSLPITQLAEASKQPAHFIGLHFFSPVDKMPLVEVICGEKTSEETLAKAADFVRQIGKTPIVVNDSLGFYTSRVFATPLAEAAEMVAEGVHPERIERLAKELDMPVGPLASSDEVSQRLAVDIWDTQISTGLVDPNKDPTPFGTQVVRDLVKKYNRGGRHYGGGFYEYSDQEKKIWPELITQYYRPDVDAAISDQDIKDRLLFRPVIESLLCLQEGVLRSAEDGNVGSLLGIGAPKWTGGYLAFVNNFGLNQFDERCTELVEAFGDRFSTPEIVEQKLRDGLKF